MLPVQWRRFNFFEKDLVRQGDIPHPELKVHESLASDGSFRFLRGLLGLLWPCIDGCARGGSFECRSFADTYRQKLSVTCGTSGRQILILGDICSESDARA